MLLDKCTSVCWWTHKCLWTGWDVLLKIKNTAKLCCTGWPWFSLVHFGGEEAKNIFVGKNCSCKSKNLSLGVRSSNLNFWSSPYEVQNTAFPQSLPVFNSCSLHRGMWWVGRERTPCSEEKYRRTKWVISSGLERGGEMRSETEWHCRQTDLKELQEDLCDLSEPKFSVSKPSTNSLMWRKQSASEECPEWRWVNVCKDRKWQVTYQFYWDVMPLINTWD